VIAYLDESMSWYGGKFILSVGVYIARGRSVISLDAFYRRIARQYGAEYLFSEPKFSTLLQIIKKSTGRISQDILRHILAEFIRFASPWSIYMSYVFMGTGLREVARAFLPMLVSIITNVDRRSVLMRVFLEDRCILGELAKKAGVSRKHMRPDNVVLFVASILSMIPCEEFVLDKNMVPRKKEYQLETIARLLGIKVSIQDSQGAPPLQVADFLAGILKHAEESWGTYILRASRMRIVVISGPYKT